MHDTNANPGHDRRLLFWRCGAVSWGLLYVVLMAGLVARAVEWSSPLMSLVALGHGATIVVWFAHVMQRELTAGMRTAIARLHAVGIVVAAVTLGVGMDQLRILSVAGLLFYLVGLFAAFARPAPEERAFAHAVMNSTPGEFHHALPIAPTTIEPASRAADAENGDASSEERHTDQHLHEAGQQ